jgi:DNA end-binding protein Ku
MGTTVWRGYLMFGLISMPIRLCRAARAERVSLRRLYRAEVLARAIPDASEPPDVLEDDPEDGSRTRSSRGKYAPEPSGPISLPEALLSPVRQASLPVNSDKVLPEQSVVKGYEFEKDRYVVIDREELKSIAAKTGTEMQIEEFVDLAEVDPVYFETSYYVVPEEAGQRAYALLYRALQLSGLVAVARLAMHSREHVVIVRPGRKGLMVHTMYFNSEVRADQEYPADTAQLSPKELDLAQALIRSLANPFEPAKYRDTYREKLEEIIARKVAGQPVSAPQKPVRAASIVDITEALQKSLAALKRPPASEPEPRVTKKAAPAQRKKTANKVG